MDTSTYKTDFIAEDCHNHASVLAHVREEMPTEESLEALAELFQCFADPTRIKILYALSQTELCVCAVAELLDLTHSAISHQLCKLRSAGLVKARKEGKMVIYSLADAHVRTLISVGFEHCKEEYA